MSARSLLRFVLGLFLLACVSSGCVFPECDSESEEYDLADCDATLFNLIATLTEAAYGETEPLPPSQSAGGCVSLPCRGAQCRQVLENGGFEERLGLEVAHFSGGAHTDDVVCLGETGMVVQTSTQQWIALADVIPPAELANADGLRARVRVWANSLHATGTAGTLHLDAWRLGSGSSEDFIEARPTTFAVDDDPATWEPIDLVMMLPPETRFLTFNVDATPGDSLFLDYAQVALDQGNQAPTAYHQTGTLREDEIWGFYPNATDPDGSLNLLSVQTSDPQNGTVNEQIYTPRPDYFGDDTFTYRVADDQGFFSNEATVTLTILPVEDVPVSNDDFYALAAGSNLLLVPADIGVLANDRDGDGDALTAILVQDAPNGTLTLADNGGFTYVPGDDFAGTDQFTYIASDGDDTSAEVTVTITGEAGNQPPIANDDTASTPQGITVQIVVFANDIDPDGTLNPDAITIIQQPTRGEVFIEPGGFIFYLPDPTFTGVDTFTYTIEDNEGAVSNEATVTVTVG